MEVPSATIRSLLHGVKILLLLLSPAEGRKIAPGFSVCPDSVQDELGCGAWCTGPGVSGSSAYTKRPMTFADGSVGNGTICFCNGVGADSNGRTCYGGVQIEQLPTIPPESPTPPPIGGCVFDCRFSRDRPSRNTSVCAGPPVDRQAIQLAEHRPASPLQVVNGYILDLRHRGIGSIIPNGLSCWNFSFPYVNPKYPLTDGKTIDGEGGLFGVNLDDNRLHEIPDIQGVGLGNSTVVSLRQNQIVQIDGFSFSSFNVAREEGGFYNGTLMNISLDDNYIQQIPATLFDNIRNEVGGLNISFDGNFIRVLPAGMFKLSVLRSVVFSASRNQLGTHEWNDPTSGTYQGTFRGFFEYFTLLLDFNEMKCLPGFFSAVEALARGVHLSANHNRLGEPVWDGGGVQRSYTICTGSNSLWPARPLGLGGGAQDLSLSFDGNRYSTMPNIFEGAATTLMVLRAFSLSLNDNRLETVEGGLFAPRTSEDEEIGWAVPAGIEWSWLPSIRLSFANNMLRDLPWDLLEGVIRLDVLSLNVSGNLLRSFTSPFFENITQVDNEFSVDLSRNRLERIPPELLTAIPRLNPSSLLLSFDGNRITSLPLPFLARKECYVSLKLSLASNMLSEAGPALAGVCTCTRSCTPKSLVHISFRNNSLSTSDLEQVLASYSNSSGELQLDFSYNDVSKLPDTLFGGIGSDIKDSSLFPSATLSLRNNRLQVISPRAFSGSFRVIPGDLQCYSTRPVNLVDLTLDISNNAGVSFPSERFNFSNACVTPPLLEWEWKPWTYQVQVIETLSIVCTECNLSDIPYDSFVNYGSKRVTGSKQNLYLDFSNNAHARLRPVQKSPATGDYSTRSFGDSVYVVTRLRNISLDRLVPSGLEGYVGELDLSSNDLTSVPGGAFAGSRFVTLSLASNFITSISGTAWDPYDGSGSALTSLNLSDNQLRRLEPMLTSTIPDVHLIVSNNNISELPLYSAFSRVFSNEAAAGNFLICDSYSPYLDNCTCSHPDSYTAADGIGQCTSHFANGADLMASCTAVNDVKSIDGVCLPDCDGPKLRRSGRSCKHCEELYAATIGDSGPSSGLSGGAIAGIIIALIIMGVFGIQMTVGLPGARDRILRGFRNIQTKADANPYTVPRNSSITNPAYIATQTSRERVESVTLKMNSGSSEM